MSGSQYILLGLVALTSWVGFIEAGAHSGYRITASRFVVALIVPCFWAALIIFSPFENWMTATKNPELTSEIFRRFVFFPLFLLLIVTAPIWFIGSVIVWIGAA